MKIRTGFVSNSSSSSFVIEKAALTKMQRFMILDYQETAHFLNFLCKSEGHEYLECIDDEPWEITEDNVVIEGETMMDNFDMRHFLDQIGVNGAFIKWSEPSFD